MDISKWFDNFVDIEPNNYDSCELVNINNTFCYKFKITTINNCFLSKKFDDRKLAEYAAQECLKKIRGEE